MGEPDCAAGWSWKYANPPRQLLFRAGDVDTGFLDREGDALAEAGAAELPAFLREALLQIDDGVSPEAIAQSPKPKADEDPWTTLRGWRA